MKNKKEMLLGSIVATAIIASFTILGCNKENPMPNESNPIGQNQRNGNPTTQTQNSLVAQKAYLAAFNTSGSCTGGPIVTHNAVISYFSLSGTPSQTTINDQLCYVTGVTWNSSNCILYYAVGTPTQGYSDLWKVNSDGSLTQLGSLTTNGSAPLYVSEMECDQNGDLYIIGPGSGTNVDLWKVAYADLGNSTITATDKGTIYSNPTRSGTHMESLSWNANDGNLYLTWELNSNSTDTKVSILSKTTAGLSSTTTYTGLSPNTNDFASFWSGGTLYFAKSGNYYTLASGTVTTLCSGCLTMSTRNDMTYRGTCAP